MPNCRAPRLSRGLAIQPRWRRTPRQGLACDPRSHAAYDPVFSDQIKAKCRMSREKTRSSVGSGQWGLDGNKVQRISDLQLDERMIVPFLSLL